MLDVAAPGIDAFASAFSATVEIDSVRKVLRSTDGVPGVTLVKETEKTPYGVAQVAVSTVAFPADKLALDLRVGQIAGVPGVLVQPVLHNRGTQPVKLLALTAIDMPAPPPALTLPREGDKVWLAPGAATAVREGHGKCQADRSTGGNPITIGGRVFAHGLGTHARSEIEIPLGGAFKRFQAFVGADDEEPGASVGFEVLIDGKKRFDSGVMKRGEPAKAVDVDVSGANNLLLVVNDGGNGITCDHADWADACLLVNPAVDAPAAARARLALPGPAGDWLVTAYDQSTNGGPANYVATIAELARGMNVREYGSVYRKDGAGFLFGPVGEPLAYLENRVSPAKDGVSLTIASEMSGVTVDPGESRAGQQAVLLMEPPRRALARWAEWVAKTHGSRTDKGALAGWCSWYHLTKNIKGSDVLGIVDAVKGDPARLRPQVIQIDDGYQDIDGKWDANGKFSEGLPFYAKRIAETGARPGLWMAMTMIGVRHPWLQDPANMEAVWGKKFKKESGFRPDESGWLDPTHPRAKEHIVERIRHAVDSGFTYLKLDFNNIGNGGWHEKKKTSFQVLREHYQRMRKAAGEDTYILACIVEPNRAVLGLVDAHRISHDAHRGGVRSAVNDVLRSYQLNGRWMAVDNDIYYIAPDAKEVGNVQGGWNLHRTWLSMMGLSGGAALTSDPWHWDVLKPQRRTVEIMQPPAKIRTEVLDLGTAKEWPRLAAVVKRPLGDQGLALLWNPDERQPRTVTLDFAETGLDPSRTYAVWSFWDNKFLGTAKGAWTTPPLEGWACQEVVLTPIDGPAAGKPVLIGSNLHISGGAAEVKDVAASGRGIKVELTDAGAREGEIFFHSDRPLRPAGTSGCVIEAVEAAGDNVWKVKLSGRQPNQPQSFELAAGAAAAPARAATVPETCYLFAYFLNNGEDGLHLAWSPDGLKWQALNGGDSYLKPEVGKSKLMRDPCVTTGPDGTFHMVWTDSWFSGTIGYASSKDLIHWSQQRALPVMAYEPGTRNCWAPEIVYDAMNKNFRIFWASTVPGKFPETDLGGRNDLNHRIYSTTTKDFESFSPTSVYFDPGHNVIDATHIGFRGKTVMIYKDETKIPAPMKNLKVATAGSPAGPFTPVPGSINPPGSWVEGPTALRVGNEVLLYFDAYTRHRYEALATTDFKTWRDVTGGLNMPAGIRHGTALPVRGDVVNHLIEAGVLAASR